MEPINPQDPVSQDLMKQMESIQQMPPVAPVAPAAPQPTTSGGMNYAGFWRRVLASIIDSILLALIGMVIGSIIPAWNSGFFPIADYYSQTISLAFLLIILNGLPAQILWFAYSVLFIVSTGKTIGKMVMGIKVISLNGMRVSWGQAIIRELFTIVSGLALGLGYLSMLWDKDKQTWHDKVAKTYVIKIR